MIALKKRLVERQDLISQLADELATTRKILFNELLEAFDVTECSDSGFRYQIASLPVPSLHELHSKWRLSFSLLPSELTDIPYQSLLLSAEMHKHQLNAILSSVVLLLKLVAKYLGIQLPFPPVGTPSKPLIHALPRSSHSYR